MEHGFEEEVSFVAQNIQTLSSILGFPESSLRFFLSILIGYPLAIVPRNFFHDTPASIQHIFYIVVGLTLSYFNFGTDAIHFIITIIVNHVLLSLGGGSRTSVTLSVIFNMAYFMVGTYFASDGSHSIAWDTPQCVLCLKAMGVAFDLYDGQKPKEELSHEQNLHYLSRAPSLLEFSGFTFFFGGFLVGPQFSMRRYLYFTNHGLVPEWEEKNPSNVVSAMTRFSLGVVYILVNVVLQPIYCNSYLFTRTFKESSLLYKLYVVTMWGFFNRCKYIGVWLFTEGSCILSGIAYSGMDEQGNALWEGCVNVKVVKMETATTFRDMVASFNTNTNKWVGRCIYKRLKFLGSRQLSQLIALFFFAAWHGLYVGYYHCFSFELFCLNFDEQWQKCWKKLGLSSLSSNPVGSLLLSVFAHIFISFCLAYPLLSFELLTWRKFNEVYGSLYYIGHIWFIGWALAYPFIIKPLLERDRPSNKDTAKEKIK